MKKNCILCAGMIVAILLVFQVSISAESTNIKFCLWPDIGTPAENSVSGFNFGLVTYGDKVVGVDYGIFGSVCKKVNGLKLSLFSNGEKLSGCQIGIANSEDEAGGCQIGIFNQTGNFTSGVQVGLVNRIYDATNGIQIGAVNVMEDGIFRILPLINFPKNWIFKEE